MAVFKRRYRPYAGRFTPANIRFLVVPKFAFTTLFDSKPFLAYFVGCFIPTLLSIGVIYITNSPAAQLLLHLQGQLKLDIDNFYFVKWFVIQGTMAFIMTAWIGPGLVSVDLAHDALPLFLSRPFSRADYLLGKAAVLAALLSAITWVPGLLLFSFQANMAPAASGWLGKNWYIAGALLLGSWMWIAILSLLSLALSAWVKWRAAASGLMFAIFAVTPGFGEAVNEVLRTNWGKLLNLGYLMNLIWFKLFRVAANPRARGEDVPLTAAWITLLVVCAVCLWLLNTRLRAREVVRG